MAIPRKPIDECSTIHFTLCGEIKKMVWDRIDRERKENNRTISQELALKKILLEKCNDETKAKS